VDMIQDGSPLASSHWTGPGERRPTTTVGTGRAVGTGGGPRRVQGEGNKAVNSSILGKAVTPSRKQRGPVCADQLWPVPLRGGAGACASPMIDSGEAFPPSRLK
jgi:hypothetical protein